MKVPLTSSAKKRDSKFGSVRFGTCADGDEYQDVEVLLDVRGPPENRYWRVKWAGKDENGEDRWPDKGAGNGTASFGWQAEVNLSVGCVDLQNSYWRATGKDRRSECKEDGEHRCEQCNQIFQSGAALKRHAAKPTTAIKAFVCKKRKKVRKQKGTEVDRLVQKIKRKMQLESLPPFAMEAIQLAYKIEVEYLGHMFTGDGQCDVDVARRTAIARAKFNSLGWLWRSKKLTGTLKVMLFVLVKYYFSTAVL